jgi:putative spermidine/putrescine transport system permease protein
MVADGHHDGAAGDRADDDRGDPAHRRHPKRAVTAGSFRNSVLPGVLGLFILFLCGPKLTILVLSFQGPDGGLAFPMNGFSVQWCHRLLKTQAEGDFAGSLTWSFTLATMVTAATMVAPLTADMALRRRFRGSGPLFTLTVASLFIPSILASLG